MATVNILYTIILIGKIKLSLYTVNKKGDFYMKRKNDEKQKNNSMLPKTKQANFTSVAIIIAACVLVVAVTLMAVIFGTSQSPDDSGKEQLEDTIKLNILSGSFVEEMQYNVWFDIDCDKTEGTITLTPTIGFVMCMENANEANVKIVESINVTDVDKYTYIWCVDKEDKDQIGYVDVAFEDKTQLKTASIYALFHEGTIGFLERDQYAEYEDAVQKANGAFKSVFAVTQTDQKGYYSKWT